MIPWIVKESCNLSHILSFYNYWKSIRNEILFLILSFLFSKSWTSIHVFLFWVCSEQCMKILKIFLPLRQAISSLGFECFITFYSLIVNSNPGDIIARDLYKYNEVDVRMIITVLNSRDFSFYLVDYGEQSGPKTLG